MKKSLPLWQLAGFLFVGIAGTVLHFVYDWTNQSFVASLFSAVNESVWEHMKLLFFPAFVFALVQSLVFAKEYENFWCAKLIGISAGLAAIPVLYYTYTGVLGTSADWFNIAIFFIAAVLAFLVETRLLKKEKKFCFSPLLAFSLLCLLFIAFILLTFIPPEIPLFLDPVTKLYGIHK